MNIIITGASRGIGYEIALNLIQSKDNHVIAIARDSKNLEKLKQESKKMSSANNLSILSFDLSQDDYSKINVLFNQFDEFNILINNAGLLIPQSFHELQDEDWIQHFQVNVFGPVRMIRKFLPKMGLTSKAHVVNISSMGGIQGSVKFAGLSAYSSSKAAIINLTEVLAEEYKNRNIAFNCLALGAVQTEMLAEAFPNFKAPLSAKEMAEFISYFSLNGAKFMNGKTIQLALSTP